MVKRRVRVHVFVPNSDLGTDHKGQRFCAHCPLPEGHSSHTMPETSQAARDRDAAVLGEKQSGD
jgi:hypothetical protein